ncbi:MAG: polysulfide reductase NrfD [Firmicutes bacterium]|nr:polysulfide reductase NrfD [Bacillota bacterium]MCL5039735.1 polysulfide reductase NrfD [Bacillota bacterium]
MSLQTNWGSLVAWYLFLAGAGAGVYMVAALATFGGKSSRFLVRPGVFLGAPLVAAGSLLLLLDLGRPERFLYAVLRPFSSMISVGTIILSVFLLIGFWHLWLLGPGRRKEDAVPRWLVALGAIFAVGTATYTGLLLGVVRAIPFWNNPLLPFLFLVSSASSGLGIVLLWGVLQRRSTALEDREGPTLPILQDMARIDSGLLVLEALLLLFFLLVMVNSGPAAAASVGLLVSGGYAAIFWLLVIGIGLLLPLGLEIWMSRQHARQAVTGLHTLAAISGLCLLAGSLSLRYIILLAGAKMPLW